MKWMLAALAVLALAVVAVPAVAGQMQFTQPYQVRIGQGDLPTTSAHEPTGWTVAQTYTWQHAAGAEDKTFLVPPGAAHMDPVCTCGNVTWTATEWPATPQVVVHVPDTAAAGMATLTVTTSSAGGQAFAAALSTLGADGVAIVYAPAGAEARAPVEASQKLGSTDGQSTIETFPGLSGSFWIDVAPAGQAVAAPAPAAGTSPWLYAAAGLILGAALWAFLVSKGLAQRRSRKQVAATAAHVEAAKAEPVAVLEGRKRALMAALKEVELARQGDEMDVPTYDTLKAELKKEAVTVMRAIDEAKGAAR